MNILVSVSVFVILTIIVLLITRRKPKGNVFCGECRYFHPGHMGDPDACYHHSILMRYKRHDRIVEHSEAAHKINSENDCKLFEQKGIPNG